MFAGDTGPLEAIVAVDVGGICGGSGEVGDAELDCEVFGLGAGLTVANGRAWDYLERWTRIYGIIHVQNSETFLRTSFFLRRLEQRFAKTGH